MKPKLVIGMAEHPLINGLRERGLLGMVERHAREHYVTVDDILGDGRTASITSARHAIWHELYETTKISSKEVGLLFGRDHCTVLAVWRRPIKTKAQALIETYGKLRVV